MLNDFYKMTFAPLLDSIALFPSWRGLIWVQTWGRVLLLVFLLHWIYFVSFLLHCLWLVSCSCLQ